MTSGGVVIGGFQGSKSSMGALIALLFEGVPWLVLACVYLVWHVIRLAALAAVSVITRGPADKPFRCGFTTPDQPIPRVIDATQNAAEVMQ